MDTSNQIKVRYEDVSPEPLTLQRCIPVYHMTKISTMFSQLLQRHYSAPDLAKLTLYEDEGAYVNQFMTSGNVK